MAEAMRRAYANRARYLGDPDFNPDMLIADLLSKAYATRVRDSIDGNAASPSIPAASAGAMKARKPPTSP